MFKNFRVYGDLFWRAWGLGIDVWFGRDGSWDASITIGPVSGTLSYKG